LTEEGACAFERVSAARAEDVVVSDLGESAWQHVLQESRDGLLGGEDAELDPARAGITIAEGDVVGNLIQ
jgi:hypothetical protein